MTETTAQTYCSAWDESGHSQHMIEHVAQILRMEETPIAFHVCCMWRTPR